MNKPCAPNRAIETIDALFKMSVNLKAREKRKKMYKYLLGLMLITLSVSVEANTVSLKYHSAEDTISSKVKVNNNTVSGLFGSYNIQEYGSADTILAFCVDPYQLANSSFNNYVKSDLDTTDFINNGAARFQNVQKLFDNAYSLIVGNDTKSAGFHLALWEIFNDNSNVASGNIKTISGTNAAMRSYADDLLDSLNGWETKGLYDLTFYKSGKYQDYLGVSPVSSVPVPAALPLLASSLVGLGFMRRRKNV